MRCDTCDVMRRIEESKEPACCAWYLDHVVILGETVEDCTTYEPLKGESDV